jgi:two-component system, OmpR family, response regulator ChvI
MAKVAVIEDDAPTSNQLASWIRAARPGIEIEQWFTRDDAEAAVGRERYDVVVLDIELGRERNAGIAIINAINKLQGGTPVLVVSAMPAAIYRGIMKALDAWDYLQKTTFEEADFIETFLDILRAAQARGGLQPGAAAGAHAAPDALSRDPLPSDSRSSDPRPLDLLSLDPLRQRTPTWRGERINLPLTAQRILAALYERRGEIVSYEELFDTVKSGRTRDNVRKHVSTIREAFRDVDPAFDAIESVPMRGFRWAEPAAVNTRSGKR